MRLVVEPDGRRREAALTLDPDVERPVDHDLRHRVVGEQPLDRAMAEDVVRDLVDKAKTVVAREPRLLAQLQPDVPEHAVAQLSGIHVDVEELRAEVADDREMNAVLELGERVAGSGRLDQGTGSGETLVELHRYLRP